MFIKLFIRILAIFCMIGFGILARKLNMLNRDTAGQMSRVVTNFFYPALIFTVRKIRKAGYFRHKIFGLKFY